MWCRPSIVPVLLGLLFAAELGCASMVKSAAWMPKAVPGAKDGPGTTADQQGAANVATGDVAGISYQSVLPMGMVILLTIIVLSQTAANSLDDWFAHRQQILRLRRNGGHP